MGLVPTDEIIEAIVNRLINQELTLAEATVETGWEQRVSECGSSIIVPFPSYIYVEDWDSGVSARFNGITPEQAAQYFVDVPLWVNRDAGAMVTMHTHRLGIDANGMYMPYDKNTYTIKYK